MMTQIPNEDLFFNGRMTTAWLMFFQSLSLRSDLLANVDLLDLLQLVKQLPPQASEAESLRRIEQLEALTAMQLTVIAQEPIQPIMPLSVTALPSDEIIPTVAAHLAPLELMPFVSMQIYAHNEPLPLNSLDDQLLQVINP